MKHKLPDDRADKTHVMPKAQRLAWLMAYFSAPNRPTYWYENTLNEEFVQKYTDATNVPYAITIIGANRCPTLSRDLATLYKSGDLERVPGGVGDCRSLGFPSWTWMYRLTSKDTEK